MAGFPSFSRPNSVPLYVYMYHIFFIHLSVDGPLGCFHMLAFVNKAAMKMKVQMSLQDPAFIPSGYVPTSGIVSGSSSLQVCCAVLCLIAQSCPTLCDPMDCSPPGPSIPGDSPGKNTGVGCYSLLQGIFQTQGSTQDLLHWRQILYQLNYQGDTDCFNILIYLFNT